MPDLAQPLASALEHRYTIERELGRGGMATVYLARDLRHRRPVALKVLRPELGSTIGTERFLREIEVVAGLTHPHILPLHDSGRVSADAGEGELLWFTMPYIEGESLRDRIAREAPMPVEDAVRLASEIADALAYAHARGVVHRDLKPANILLSAGHALVADFGIARAAAQDGDARLTGTGLSLGTPHYMSPEQAVGDREVDDRTDIYALGCVLFEMLAGEPPFSGPTAHAVIVKRCTESAPSVRARRSGIPEALDSAVAKALARDPAERFATAAEFAAAIGGGLAPTVDTAAGAAPAREARSIAVLPFTDMSPARDQEHFADGMAEEIINALTRIASLRVTARTSSFAFKGKNEDAQEIGRKLRAGTLLEGSVRKAGNRLRVTAQLVNAANGYQLWSDHYDRDLDDVFAIQDQIAANIVRALELVLSEDERRALTQTRRVDARAYELYLRGRQFFHRHQGRAVQNARQLFARATEIDPGFVLAYAGIADCSFFLGASCMFWDAGEADFEQAEAASEKALELGPEVAEAHASRGLALSLRRRFDKAEREFETAIRLNARLFEAYYFYGRVCFQQGKFAEAARRFEQAASVRPEDYQALGLAGNAYWGMGQQEQAMATFRREVAVAEQHLELNPDDARALYLTAVSLAVLGERDKALAWADRALALDPGEPSVLYNVACVYARLGLTERALDTLEQAVGDRSGHVEWIAHDPDLESLRELPRFRALVDRL
ncbi:MAG TPA: protein kinase [Gemmatimonadales bacterium]|nr:protein kinase [Gemmatimonadales bacterium]